MRTEFYDFLKCSLLKFLGKNPQNFVHLASTICQLPWRRVQNFAKLRQIGLLSIRLGPNQFLDFCFLKLFEMTQKDVIQIVRN